MLQQVPKYLLPNEIFNISGDFYIVTKINPLLEFQSIMAYYHIKKVCLVEID